MSNIKDGKKTKKNARAQFRYFQKMEKKKGRVRNSTS